MDGKLLVVGRRYLFRLSGKQVPVVFDGWEERPRTRPGGLEYRYLLLRRLDNGDVLKRRAARALSRHYDTCALGIEDPRCTCISKLMQVVDNGRGDPTIKFPV